MRPKRHHYVPVLHLKHFVGSDPKGQIWTFDKETGASRSGTPENTAVESHFYSAENDDGTLDTRLEEFLAKIEGIAAPTYEKLATGQLPASEQHKADFATFVALQYLRTPAIRRDAAEIVGRTAQIRNYAYASNDKAFESLLRRVEAGRGKPFEQEEKDKLRQSLADPTKFIVRVAKERTFIALGAVDKLGPILFEMNWSLVRPQHGYFITSDNPVVLWVDPQTRHPVLGDHGFYNKTAEVSFPLSPKMALLMSWNPDLLQEGMLKRDDTWSINKMRASHADRYIFAHVCRKQLQQLATSFKGSRPRMTTQGFGPKEFAKVEVSRRRQKVT